MEQHPAIVRVTRLDGAFDEAAILAALAAESLRPSTWSNGPGDRYSAHAHAYHKVLYCLAGSITFHLADAGGDVELHPGDRLDIPPGTQHAATVGAHGVICVEAARG
jgi:quercetin dioxygenase-like cupin family protein